MGLVGKLAAYLGIGHNERRQDAFITEAERLFEEEARRINQEDDEDSVKTG